MRCVCVRKIKRCVRRAPEITFPGGVRGIFFVSWVRPGCVGCSSQLSRDGRVPLSVSCGDRCLPQRAYGRLRWQRLSASGDRGFAPAQASQENPPLGCCIWRARVRIAAIVRLGWRATATAGIAETLTRNMVGWPKRQAELLLLTIGVQAAMQEGFTRLV